jgi:hypothetical protein
VPGWLSRISCRTSASWARKSPWMLNGYTDWRMLGLGERVTEEEARAIGNALVAGPLSTVNWVSKVFPPSSYFRDAPGDHRDYDKDTQWPAWLRALAEFCLTCKGFEVC